MRTGFLLILYPLIFIAQIGFLVFALRSKKKSNWIYLMIFNTIAVFLSTFLCVYFADHPGNGMFGNLGEYVVSLIAIVLHLFMMIISICCGIVSFELNLRKQNKNYVTPFCLILATLFIAIGVVALGHEVLTNRNIREVNGVVSEIKEVNRHESIVIDYEVEGEKYQGELRRKSENIGDKVNIEVSCNQLKNCNISYRNDNKVIYIPALIIGLFIILFRFKDGIDKKN